MAKTRISRSRKRELDAPDEFLTFSGKLLKFIAENKQRIGAGVAITAALVLILSGARYYSYRTEKQAFDLLDKGIKKTGVAQKGGDPRAVYKAVNADFKNILEKYAGKKAGKIARVVFANIVYEAGEYDAAIALYKQALGDFKEDPLYRCLILTSLAYACEQKQDYENADKYMKMINLPSDFELSDDVLFNLGRIQSRIHPDEKVNPYYKKILEAYPNSIYADMAREKSASAL